MTLCRASVSWASKKVHSGRRDAFSIIPIMINYWDIVVTVGASGMSIHSKCTYKRGYNEEMKNSGLGKNVPSDQLLLTVTG